MKFRHHRIVMALPNVLYLTFVLYVMIPSFVKEIIQDYFVPSPFAIKSVVGLIYGILGTTALLLVVWLVASWSFRKNLKGFFNKKKFICKTLNVWIASTDFGIILYAIFIGYLLAS
jgi:Mn2+/Fe2+ NRAMP family transporter